MKFSPYSHPESPAQIYMFIHGRLVKAAEEFEMLAKQLNRKDAEQVSILSNKYEFLKNVLAVHEEGEELILFPALESKFRRLTDSYVFDHEHQNLTILDEITKSFADLLKSPDTELSERLYRQSVALSVMLQLHVVKENELLLPVLYENFTSEEQAGLMKRMSAHAPPELAKQSLGWTFRELNANERLIFLRMMKQVMPPDPFKGLIAGLSTLVPAAEWQTLEMQMPDLKA